MTAKGGVRYGYYVSCALSQGLRDSTGSVPRVPAPEVERVVIAALRAAAELSEVSDSALIGAHVERIVVRPDSLEVSTRGLRDDFLDLPWSKPPLRRRREVIGGGSEASRPIRSETRERLLNAIARARLWLAEFLDGSVEGTAAMAEREGLSERAVRMTLSLAFLAPDLVAAAVAGTLPHGARLSAMTELPPAWTEQRSALVGLNQRRH